MKYSGSAGTVIGMRSDEGRERLQRLRSLAWLLDSSIPLPGGFRVGLDAIVGLLPVIGDVAGALVSGFILNEARLLGAPRSVLVRMSANVMIETILGAVPLLGDLFDAGFKANLRNIALLERYHLDPQGSRQESRGVVALMAVLLVGLVVVMIAIPVLLLTGLVNLLT
jgi:hypothetical protein